MTQQTKTATLPLTDEVIGYYDEVKAEMQRRVPSVRTDGPAVLGFALLLAHERLTTSGRQRGGMEERRDEP